VVENKPKGESLDPPPIAFSNPEAKEIARVWFEPNSINQMVLRTTWNDPGAWGLLLVDMARHVAQAYKNEGHDHQAALNRIKQIFELEWSQPTDSPIQVN